MGATHPAGIGPNQLVGLTLGMVPIMSVFILGRVAEQAATNCASRKTTTINRNFTSSGYSLSCRIDDLNEKWNFWAALSIAAGGMFGMIVSVLYPVVE